MTFHSQTSLGARHSIHNWEDADLTARNARVYANTDVGKVTRVGVASPYTFYLVVGQTAGVGAFEAIEAPPDPSTVHVWMPGAPPLTPHSRDDEGDGLALDLGTLAGGNKWQEWDPDSKHAWDLNTARQTIRCTALPDGAPGIRVAGGIFQVVPASEFAFCTRVLRCPGGELGLFVSADVVASPATANYRTCAYGQGLVRACEYAQYDSETEISATLGTIARNPATWLRMRCNGTTVASDFSNDGNVWFELASVTAGFTPVHFGIFVLNADDSSTRVYEAEFFRVFSGGGTSAFDATEIGRLMPLFYQG